MTELQLKIITKVGSIPIYYDRNEPKWQPNPKVKMKGTAELQRSLGILGGKLVDYGHKLEMILSAGMYVNKAKQHGKGRAVDIDGFVHSNGTRLMAHAAEKNWAAYLGYEGILRQIFGQVLNHDYNVAHHDHWHCDLANTLGFRRSSKAQAVFVQRSLNVFWQTDLIVDGDYGPKSRQAYLEAMKAEINPSWPRFLDTVARKHPALK